jgi:hypothetical protein
MMKLAQMARAIIFPIQEGYKAMSYGLHVFVSSTCYELRDLRAGIKAWLTKLGVTPLMSDDRGFPHIDAVTVTVHVRPEGASYQWRKIPSG